MWKGISASATIGRSHLRRGIRAIPAIVSVVTAFSAIRSGPLRSAAAAAVETAGTLHRAPQDEEERNADVHINLAADARFCYSKSRLAASSVYRCKRTTARIQMH